MAYTHYSRAHPVATDDKQDVVDYARTNNNAALDAILMGWLPGYVYTIEAGDPDAPTTIYWTKGNDIVRVVYTYDVDGFVETATASLSENGGSSWTTISVATITYDGDKYVTGFTSTQA